MSESKTTITANQPTTDQRLIDVIHATLQRFGARLPPEHENASIDERIALMRLLSGHVAKAVTKELGL